MEKGEATKKLSITEGEKIVRFAYLTMKMKMEEILFLARFFASPLAESNYSNTIIYSKNMEWKENDECWMLTDEEQHKMKKRDDQNCDMYFG